MPNWTDDIVLGTSNASAGDDELRSFMTQLASGISAGFNWPGSGGSTTTQTGWSVLGNARTARAGNSAVTGGHGNGFLLFNTAHASLHHLGSSWTAMLGHSSMIDHRNSLGQFDSITSARWLTQAGTFSIDTVADGSFGTKLVTFPSAYSNAPAFIALTAQQPTINVGYIVNVLSSTSTTFIAVYNANLLGVATSNVTVHWESDGTAALIF